MAGCVPGNQFLSSALAPVPYREADEGIAINYANDYTLERLGIRRLCEDDENYGERAIGAAQLPQHTVCSYSTSNRTARRREI
jgi:hypothetical protein